ncbi:M56 family metallopeptidase [Microtetraspora malaysiensis]|uniref:M56 family metallopeptidase n=1 Tax=Microtetraspora malaysiensis TaxID=161358 RepID=UPI000837A2B7|nr:M56 family metallopeptidase [Microtetraspora malaysiensis]
MGWLIATAIAMTPILLGGRMAERLATAAWASRHPRAALVLWQAIGLAGGLGAIGAGLVAAVTVFPHGLHQLGHQVVDGRGLAGLGPVRVAALAWAVVVPAWLLLHTVRATVRTVAEQRRQRLLVDVAAEHRAEHDIYVLPGSSPVAYCVPGSTARVVLSRGALQLLSERELAAVLAHERAHARGRHDRVLLPFIALAGAFPWLPAVRTARSAVPVLLEMIADDRACRGRDRLDLARAIVHMITPGSSPVAAAPGLADAAVVQRVERLLHARTTTTRWAGAAAYGTAIALMMGPVVVLAAPIACVVIWPG